jgi:hypothetical protein
MRVWPRIILILIIALSGCASTRNYEISLNDLIGSHKDKLVSTFGQPNKSYNLPDGRTVIEYSRSRVVEENVGEPYLYKPGGYSGDEYITPEIYNNSPDIYQRVLWCKTSFVLDQNGIITSWSHKGNDCKSLPVK